MPGLFSKPKIEAPPAPPPPPSVDPEIAGRQKAEETARELEKAAKAERKTRGRASTVLTGGSGLTDEPNLAQRTLLGA